MKKVKHLWSKTKNTSVSQRSNMQQSALFYMKCKFIRWQPSLWSDTNVRRLHACWKSLRFQVDLLHSLTLSEPLTSGRRCILQSEQMGNGSKKRVLQNNTNLMKMIKQSGLHSRFMHWTAPKGDSRGRRQKAAFLQLSSSAPPESISGCKIFAIFHVSGLHIWYETDENIVGIYFEFHSSISQEIMV